MKTIGYLPKDENTKSTDKTTLDKSKNKPNTEADGKVESKK